VIPVKIGIHRIGIHLIEPLACDRPEKVRSYIAMLRARKSPPPVLLIRQYGRRYRYRVFDGAHRLRAARRVGRKTITARIVASD
jgi:uncharacterized ParB-like nuclease family protein